MKNQRIFNSAILYCSNCEVPLKRVLYRSYGKIKRQIICKCCNQYIESDSNNGYGRIIGDETFAQLTERAIKKDSFATYLPPHDGDCLIHGQYSAWFFPLSVPFDRPFVNVRLQG